jgi:hypothetical protein
MFFPFKHTNAVKPDLISQFFCGWNVLPPLTGYYVPENGKNNEANLHPRGHTVKTCGVFKSQHMKCSVNFEPGECKKNNQ